MADSTSQSRSLYPSIKSSSFHYLLFKIQNTCSKFSSHRTVSSTCIVLLSLLSQMIRSGHLFVTMIRNTNLELMSYVIFQLLFSVLMFQYIHVFLLNGNAFSSSLALFVSFLHQNHQF